MGKIKFTAAVLALSLFLCTLPRTFAAEPKYVALTFDDGPSGKYTRTLLDGLAQRDAKCTFFLCGYRLEIYPELAKDILAQGHEIGLHGYTHDAMDKMSVSALHQELDDTDKLLYTITGKHCSLLRPPGGQCTKAVERAAAERGLSLIFWSVDPRDWATHDAVAVEKSVVEEVQDGDIILLHDMSDSSVAAALSIVDALQAEDYRFVTVGELAALRGEPLEAGSIYYSIPGPIQEAG